ncbi:MAG TPA: zinc ABC transporter substrate-binding protein [Stellaceae bacterium]|nr:zinc ABC transporter substrate-binding protein [Stellaceae bacterium]
MRSWSVLAAVATLVAAPTLASAASPVVVVAAENFYGDVARQIGGDNVRVTSILDNPDQDPHLFELSPSAARAIASARIVIANGLGYDPWMEKPLRAGRRADRRTIIVAELVGKKPGDNPHIWYNPATMLAAATALAEAMSAADPAHAPQYRGRLAHFAESLKPIDAKIANLRQRLAGTPVAATEPIFDSLFEALGLTSRNRPFQLAVMNNTEPSASAIAAFETDLKTRAVRLLVYNRQVSDLLARRMVALAKAASVPVLGATETEPPGKDYQSWILSELDAVDLALSE